MITLAGSSNHTGHARNDRGEILSRMRVVSRPNGQVLDFLFVIFLGNLGIHEYSRFTNGKFALCMGYLSYVWDICLMYGVLVSCFGKKQNHMLPGCNYGGMYCLMFGIFVLCIGY